MHAKTKRLNLLTVNVCLHIMSSFCICNYNCHKSYSHVVDYFQPLPLDFFRANFLISYLYHFLSSNVRNHVNIDFMVISLDGFLLEDLCNYVNISLTLYVFTVSTYICTFLFA